jgi:hypothetical protein
VDDQLLACFQRLIDAGMDVIPSADIQNHLVVGRGEWAALIRIANGKLVGVGAAGKMSAHGFAPLISDQSGSAFVVKSYREPATDDQVLRVRSFAADLEQAIQAV